MKNYKITYKNYHIIKFGDDFIITDEHGTTKGQATTEDGAKYTIDCYIKKEEEKQKVFDTLKEIKNTTQKAQQYLYNYNSSDCTELYHCYNSYSNAKRNAFDYCLNLFKKLNGYSYNIPTHCIMTFTFAFVFDYEGQRYLCYITPTQNYKIKIGD